MGRISIKPDCGNAPRKKFLAALNTAFANGDKAFVKSNIPENITWAMAGANSIVGKEAFLEALKCHPGWKARLLTIDTIITHGPDAAVSGWMVTTDQHEYAFCDIYKFKGAGGTVIQAIMSFMIPAARSGVGGSR